ESGEERIDIYDAATGRQLRQFLGHLGTVRSLAFAPGGNLLASAADDKTVAVWSLSDLGKTWNAAGRLPGFAVEKTKGGPLRLREFTGIVDNTPAAAGLKDGQQLEGVWIKGKLEPFTAPLQVYEQFWGVKPATAVVQNCSYPCNGAVNGSSLPLIQTPSSC